MIINNLQTAKVNNRTLQDTKMVSFISFLIAEIEKQQRTLIEYDINKKGSTDLTLDSPSDYTVVRTLKKILEGIEESLTQQELKEQQPDDNLVKQKLFLNQYIPGNTTGEDLEKAVLAILGEQPKSMKLMKGVIASLNEQGIFFSSEEVKEILLS